MKKIKIVDKTIWTKFCTGCGNKNIPVLTGSYDGKTGQAEAHYHCKNANCPYQCGAKKPTNWKRFLNFDISGLE